MGKRVKGVVPQWDSARGLDDALDKALDSSVDRKCDGGVDTPIARRSSIFAGRRGADAGGSLLVLCPLPACLPDCPGVHLSGAKNLRAAILIHGY